MRYLSVYTPDQQPQAGDVPCDEDNVRMGALIDEMVKAGVMLATDGLLPNSAADAQMHYHDGKLSVVDGPFAETKELIAGFAIIQVATKDEALYWNRRFMELAGPGRCDIRLMYDTSPMENFAAAAEAHA
ncbi:YciI family protein [Silvimonas soli]|uniref:YciI family protein n=1 Tax=Silvimonas soli TaxID=2980100 RepID=UPI0024B32EFC|nr:YciI family protein [Silvimonas soli]